MQTGAWGRFVLSVFVLAWLNIAAQPCLMAMEMVPDAALASEHAAHAEHAEHMADANASTDCGHCPPGIDVQEIPCESGSASDCEIFPGYNVDGRQIKLKQEYVSPPLLLSPIENTLDFSPPLTLYSPHDYKRLKFGGTPPLNIQYCVFLK